MAPPVSTGPAGTSKGYGEIKVLSADEHKISFAHEGVPDLKLAAGTTSFKLSPSVKLEGISVGTSCDFYVDKSSGEMVVVAFGFGPAGSEPAPGGPPPPSGIPQGGGGPGPAASGAPAPPPPSGGPQAGAPPPSGGPRLNPPPPGGSAAGAPPPAGKPQPGAPPPSGAPQPKQP
ncbi:MAG: hypothetical protein EB084_15075 [Proteobacteria bacterium]|nr:hypothetical protein [Pseudomonadota bacterium]